MVRELFEMARTKKACLIFFDEIDAVGGARFDDGAGGDNEVQRTMLELINQLDGFDPRGNIKVLMATNRPDTLGMLKVSKILKYRWIMYFDFTVAINELLCLKNAGAQISLFFTSYE